MPTASTSVMASEDLRSLITPYTHEIGGPVSALRAVQDRYGWIDADAVEAVASVFNLGRAEVRGLVAFYADLRTSPPADHVITVCQAEACQAAGSRTLTRKICERVGAELGGQDHEGSLGVEPVYCLGLCARAPAMALDGALIPDADVAVDRLLDELKP